jgi:phage terminase small subunit
MSGPLANPKHERFAQELAKGTKQFEAYAKVGYAGDATHASRLGARPDVQARVEEILGRAAAKVEVTVEKVLRELALLGFANMQDYMRSGADGDPYLDFSGLTRELADKRAALVDIGRHLGMFKDKIEHSGGVTVLINGPDADL